MNVNRHKYFRWTPRTAWLTFAYVVVVPAMFGYLGFVTDVSSPVATTGIQKDWGEVWLGPGRLPGLTWVPGEI